MSTAIIDYGMGNLRSVAAAIESLGAPAHIANRPEQLASADRIILPGVGAFAAGMHSLRSGGWIDALEQSVRGQGKPFLGLCLGMQLLASAGTEHCECDGLGWIPGAVRRLAPNDRTIRVPHVGWNDVRIVRRDGLFAGLKEIECFYFVHSFHVRPETPEAVSAWCDHGVQFCAAIEFKNIMATQFHPEKSQTAGLKMLANFLKLKSRIAMTPANS